MATTTNYGWTTPDDTALVKDGASAIRTLGSSVDTTTKNLNPETTLGDISFRSSTSNVNTRLGIGGTGTVLTVAGGVPTWATAGGGGMTLLSTTALSGASVTLSSISQDYKNLQILLQGTSNSGASLYSPRIAPNGSTNITTTSGLASQTHKEFENNYLWCNMDSNVSLTDVDNIFVINIYDYASTTQNKAVDLRAGYYDNANYRSSTGGGFIKTTSAITSLVLSYGAGNFDAGTCLLYGVK